MVTTFVGMEFFLNFTPTSWTAAENVYFVFCNHVMWSTRKARTSNKRHRLLVLGFLSFLQRTAIKRGGKGVKDLPLRQALSPMTALIFALFRRPVSSVWATAGTRLVVAYQTIYTPQSWSSMSTRLINFDNAKYSLSGAQLCDEQIVDASLSTCDHRPTCVNPLKTKRRLLYLKTQFVPRSKHFSSRL